MSEAGKCLKGHELWSEDSFAFDCEICSNLEYETGEALLVAAKNVAVAQRLPVLESAIAAYEDARK